MQLYDPKRFGAPSGGLFNAQEKQRLMRLIAGFVLVLLAVAYFAWSSGGRDASRRARDSQREELPTIVAKPPIDVAAIEAAADDEQPERRAVLPAAALEAGFRAADFIYDGVYEALDGRELSALLVAEIVRAPKEHRGRLYRARCFVQDTRVIQNPSSGAPPFRFVSGQLEDGAPLCFVVREPDGPPPAPGSFVRVDGLFVRVQREEFAGAVQEAPLLIGPRIVESYPILTPVEELDPAAFASVEDDSIESGFEGLDHDTYWKLLSYVEHLEPGRVDWAAAPMLDGATIASIAKDGAAFRGKPVRLQEARLLNVWTRAESGENPLRKERMVEGWFTRGDWGDAAPVARFVAPRGELPAGVHKEMNANLRAFFYKNLAYTKRDGAVAIAPFFVVKEIEPLVPPDAPGLRQMTYVVAGTLLALGIGIVFVLRKDRAKSAELEAELLRRRRERRARMSAGVKS